ncbi:hypothetical protein DMA11_23700 [Marinilabiliaceae bacterium JC017]|nr:hypothetical protein DMA11_23700 [Marinilabiliaceae bacterium JC017]
MLDLKKTLFYSGNSFFKRLCRINARNIGEFRSETVQTRAKRYFTSAKRSKPERNAPLPVRNASNQSEKVYDRCEMHQTVVGYFFAAVYGISRWLAFQFLCLGGAWVYGIAVCGLWLFELPTFQILTFSPSQFLCLQYLRQGAQRQPVVAGADVAWRAEATKEPHAPADATQPG